MANTKYKAKTSLSSSEKSVPESKFNKTAPSRRKPKSVSHAKTIQLTPELRRKKAIKEFNHFLDTASEAEKNTIGHLKPLTYDPEDLMKEIRRLLGESIKRCIVIPFPQHLVRKSADLASGRSIKIESVVIELSKGI